MGSYGMSDEVRVLRERMRKFIDGEVIPAEPDLETEEHEPDRASRRHDGAAQGARRRNEGLWALGHPVEIGGQGVPFMSFVYLNEIIGRSHWGQAAVGSLSMQDSIMLHLYGTRRAEEALAASRWSRATSIRRSASPSPRSPARIRR